MRKISSAGSNCAPNHSLGQALRKQLQVKCIKGEMHQVATTSELIGGIDRAIKGTARFENREVEVWWGIGCLMGALGSLVFV
jgi:hypothetical protein